METTRFHCLLGQRFELRDGSQFWLGPSQSIDFCGINISMQVGDGGPVTVSIDQSREVAGFLTEFDLVDQVPRSTPMASRDLLYSDRTELSDTEAAWCRSALGQLHYLARGTRWDIAAAVSIIGQDNASPVVGTKLALQYLAGYLVDTVDFKISKVCPKSETPDVFEFYVDSGHCTQKFSSVQHYSKRRSQTGVVILMNGIPVSWRSNRQPCCADSPAAAEIYATKDGVADARLMLWVAQDFGLNVGFPAELQTDSAQAITFQEDTCVKSRMRSSIDRRQDWVEELRDQDWVKLIKVPSKDNLADILTKPMMGPEFNEMKNKTVNFQINNFLGGHVYLVDLKFVRSI